MWTNSKYEWHDELSFGLNFKLKAALGMSSFFLSKTYSENYSIIFEVIETFSFSTPDPSTGK